MQQIASYLRLYHKHDDVEKWSDVIIKLMVYLYDGGGGGGVGSREQGGDLGPRLDEGMLGSVLSGSDGEGPDCLCSRASLANWSVWVHGVQEDPRSPLAVS